MFKHRTTILLAALLLVALAGAHVRAGECKNYPTPYVEVSVNLYDVLGGEAVQTKGDIAYWFDNGHLDAISLADPTQWQPTLYQPPVNISPSPGRLLKFGDDLLAAFHGGQVSMIDISKPVPPALIATGPGFGAGMYLGFSNGHAYFFDYYDTIEIVDVTDPSDPQPAGFYQIPDSPNLVGGAVGFDRIYMNGALDFRIIDISSPAAPVQVVDYDWWPGNEAMFTEYNGPMFFEDGKLYARHGLGLGSAGATTTLLDLADPDSPQFILTSEEGLDIADANYAYGWDYDTYDAWLNVDTQYGGPVSILNIPFAERRNFRLTDSAVVHTKQGEHRVYATPRQCDPPSILPGSVKMTRIPGPPFFETRTFSWKTYEHTESVFDRVDIRLRPRSPAVCQSGAVTLGGSEVTRLANGRYKHTISKKFECLPGCSYEFDVTSRRTGIDDSSEDHVFKILSCAMP